MKEDSKKKQIVKISVFITSIFIIFLSVTYAFINQTLVGTKRQVITSGNLELELLEDENNLTIEDALPMYDEVGMIQDAFTFRLVNKTPMDTNYILKLDEIAVEGGLLREDVKYGLTKDGEVTIDLVSNIVDNVIDEGVILGNQTIEYSLRLWVKDSVTDISRIQNKSMRFKVNMSASQKMEEETEKGELVNIKAFADENLGENCVAYNDGIDTFLVGNCQNNYVWYSGKLWRIVLSNNDTGNTKVVTENAITTISYNDGFDAYPDFKDSYAFSWLNNEFLPTLHDTDKYLVEDSIWDSTSHVFGRRPAGNRVSTSAVGLLNTYEYNVTIIKPNTNGEYYDKTQRYLKNNVKSATLTPDGTTTGRMFVFIASGGISSSGDGSAASGIRPAIVFKSSVRISSGTGKRDDPYRLVGDIPKTLNGETTLNTKYSGEYIIFDDMPYRIIGIEGDSTKVVAVNQIPLLTEIQYHSSDVRVTFATASIKDNLNNYYQTLSSHYKNMVIENAEWKTTIVGRGDYNKTVRDTVIAPVGIQRMGEMFASQMSDEKYYFWTLSNVNYSGTEINVITPEAGTFSGGLSPIKTFVAARPSMYLKSNVVIASDNTGDGTYEHPYSIELGS